MSGVANLRPAPPGNQLAVTHGARAMLRLAPRAEQIADDLRTIRLLALVLARIETANEWLDEHGLFRNGKGEPQAILKNVSTWENTASRLMDKLGLTPTSRAALGLDLARTHDAQAVLNAYLRERHGDGG